VPHIPKIGDASTCPPGEALPTAKDVGVDARDVHL
jgi:hypothetical protein